MPIFSQIYLIVTATADQWPGRCCWRRHSRKRYLQLVGTRRLEKRLTRRFAVGFEHQILALPERFYSQRHTSDVAGRMAVNAQVGEFIGGELLPMATGLILLVFYLILTVLYSPILGLLILGTTHQCRNCAAQPAPPEGRQHHDRQGPGQKQCRGGERHAGYRNIKAAAIEADVFRRFAGTRADCSTPCRACSCATHACGSCQVP